MDFPFVTIWQHWLVAVWPL